MSPIALGLDILLVALLVAALVVGLRLNKKLKLLREGQAGFVKAVSDLDAAAVRAETGLRALRTASEEAHDTLLTRIETARGLIARLETASAAAERRLQEPAAAPASAPTPGPRPESRPDPRPSPAPRRPAARQLDDDLFVAEPSSPVARLQRSLGERL